MGEDTMTTTIPAFTVGDLVGLTHSPQYVRVLGIDTEAPGIVYWCKAVPGTKYQTLFERDLRKLE